MKPPEHVHERALFVVALQGRDPERVAALIHARACADCAQALSKAEQMMVALDAALPLEAPARASLDRAAAAVHRAERAVRRRASAAAAAATLLAGVLLVLAAR